MIREATEMDVNEWLRMRELLYPECDSALLLSEIKKILRNRTIIGELDYYILVHDDCNKLSGFIETSIRKGLPDYQKLPVGYIESLYVDPTNRRKGIARQLVAFSEEWVKKLNYNSFFVDTCPENSDAIQFYKSIGFKEFVSTNKEIIFKK